MLLMLMSTKRYVISCLEGLSSNFVATALSGISYHTPLNCERVTEKLRLGDLTSWCCLTVLQACYCCRLKHQNIAMFKQADLLCFVFPRYFIFVF